MANKRRFALLVTFLLLLAVLLLVFATARAQEPAADYCIHYWPAAGGTAGYYEVIDCPATTGPTASPTPTNTPTPSPTMTPTPTNTPTATNTPTPTSSPPPTTAPTIEPPPTPETFACTSFPWLNSNIRSGPGVNYSVVGVWDNRDDVSRTPVRVGVETLRLLARYWNEAEGHYWYAYQLKPDRFGWSREDVLSFGLDLRNDPACQSLPATPPGGEIHPPVLACFGLHDVIPTGGGELAQLLQAVRATNNCMVVKCVECEEETGTVLGYGGIMINRFKIGAGYLQDCVSDPGQRTPAQAAQQQIARHMPMHANIDPRAWVELDNECMEYWRYPEWLDSYLATLVTRISEEYSRRVVVLSPLAGNYTADRVRALPKTWEAMLKYDAVLGMHAYGLKVGGVGYTLMDALSIGWLVPYVRQHVQVVETLTAMNPAYGAIKIVYTEVGSTDGWDPFRPDDCPRWFNVVRHDASVAGMACWTGGAGDSVYSARGQYLAMVPWLD